MKYKVELLADYHSNLWPNGKTGQVREFDSTLLKLLVEDFGPNKLKIELLEEAPEEVKESAISKALGKLSKKP